MSLRDDEPLSRSRQPLDPAEEHSRGDEENLNTRVNKGKREVPIENSHFSFGQVDGSRGEKVERSLLPVLSPSFSSSFATDLVYRDRSIRMDTAEKLIHCQN